MKLKKLKWIFLVALIAIIPLTGTNAASYSVGIFRTPQKVYDGETITITVEVIDPIYGDEYDSASLSYWLNGAIHIHNYPEQSIPNYIEITLTFVFGPFVEGDVISYKIYLDFIYADSYQSEMLSFTVGGTRPSGLTTMEIVYIACGSFVIVVGLIILVIIQRKRGK